MPSRNEFLNVSTTRSPGLQNLGFKRRHSAKNSCLNASQGRTVFIDNFSKNLWASIVAYTRF